MGARRSPIAQCHSCIIRKRRSCSLSVSMHFVRVTIMQLPQRVNYCFYNVNAINIRIFFFPSLPTLKYKLHFLHCGISVILSPSPSRATSATLKNRSTFWECLISFMTSFGILPFNVLLLSHIIEFPNCLTNVTGCLGEVHVNVNIHINVTFAFKPPQSNPLNRPFIVSCPLNDLFLFFYFAAQSFVPRNFHTHALIDSSRVCPIATRIRRPLFPLRVLQLQESDLISLETNHDRCYNGFKNSRNEDFLKKNE